MWSTLRAIFVINNVLGWSSRKVNYMQVFPQAKLDADEEISLHIQRGIYVDDTKKRTDYVDT